VTALCTLLTDVIIVPVGIWLAIRLFPLSLVAEHRQAAIERHQQHPLRYVGVAMILGMWCSVGGAIVYGLVAMSQHIDGPLHTYMTQLGLGRGHSSQSMRATFITMALDNGAKLEDVQRTVGRADPAMTQLYDRRRLMPAKSAALVVAYDRSA
jgi:hypothetical protein